MAYPVAKQRWFFTFLSPFTECKMSIPLNSPFTSPIQPREASLVEFWVHKGEQQFDSLLVKCGMLSISLSQGPVQLRLEASSEPHMQVHSTFIFFAETAEGNSFLTELAQRVDKSHSAF